MYLEFTYPRARFFRKKSRGMHSKLLLFWSIKAEVSGAYSGKSRFLKTVPSIQFELGRPWSNLLLAIIEEHFSKIAHPFLSNSHLTSGFIQF
jgi:hypothetical protein